jgi:hypothetical protein
MSRDKLLKPKAGRPNGIRCLCHHTSVVPLDYTYLLSTQIGCKFTYPCDNLRSISDYFFRKERGFHILGSLAICLAGLIITVTVLDTRARYTGLCILTFGSYVSAPLTAAWLSGNTPGELLSSGLFRVVFIRSYRAWQTCPSSWNEWVWQPLRSHWRAVVPSFICTALFDTLLCHSRLCCYITVRLSGIQVYSTSRQ